jgi:hypothetical protein
MMTNEKLNCQVSTIFMNPRSIHVDYGGSMKHNFWNLLAIQASQ